MGKLVKLKVLLIGMRGLGVEIAKNLILAGPHTVAISDERLVELRDLSANFFVNETMIGKATGAEAVLPKLCELNPYVKVENIVSPSNKKIQGYDVVVMTEAYDGLPEAIGIN